MPEASSRNRVAQAVRAWAGETIFKRGQDYQLYGRLDAMTRPSAGRVAGLPRPSASTPPN